MAGRAGAMNATTPSKPLVENLNVLAKVNRKRTEPWCSFPIQHASAKGLSSQVQRKFNLAPFMQLFGCAARIAALSARID